MLLKFGSKPMHSSEFKKYILIADSVEWGLQEPSAHKNGKDCAVLYKIGKEIVWSTDYCRIKHQFICYVSK